MVVGVVEETALLSWWDFTARASLVLGIGSPVVLSAVAAVETDGLSATS